MRLSFRVFFLFALLFFATAARAQGIITNASPGDLRAISFALDDLATHAEGGDSTSLEAFGLHAETLASSASPAAGAAPAVPITIRARLTHLAVGGRGALARETFRVSRGETLLATGRHDVWLSRENNAWKFMRAWDGPQDAAGDLAGAAREALANASKPNPRGSVLSLVAEWRGGRWLALRSSPWTGRVLDEENLQARRSQNQSAGVESVESWLRFQMNGLGRIHADESGSVHFFFQRSGSAWVGLDAVWQPSSGEERATAGDARTVVRARQMVDGLGWLDANAHADLGYALGRVRLWNEAADALQKADLLKPGAVPAATLQTYEANRAHDPQQMARDQAERESRIGKSAEYPDYVIQSLEKQSVAGNTPLLQLQLALQYSKLAEDEKTRIHLQVARNMADAGLPLADSPSSVAWARLLFDHLRERQALASIKPRNLIRSGIFSLRCRLNDPQTLLLLGALEDAQHTVYGDFGIPMGNTEVVVWPSQRSFREYTSKFSPTSEFVAAITLTKLINTEEGPLVLGEEVNAFIDASGRGDIFGTVAHEYGHVAVRQLARGRQVPVWFNEGVATVVEGGYEGYIERVRDAARDDRLLPMSEMQEWNVDGVRAFLAYSQANSILDYVISLKGESSVREILRTVGNGTDFESALRGVLGMSSQELWNAWAQNGIK